MKLAGVLAIVAGGMLLVGAAHAETEVTAEARQHFKAGVELLRAEAGPKYEEAYLAFKAAYRASPSPKILGNLGLCALMLERDGEAIDAYRRYLEEVNDIDDEERAEIERELEVLLAGAVPFILEVEPAGEATLVDERQPVKGVPVVNRYPMNRARIELRLRAGTHRVTLTREGFAPVTLELEAVPGSPVVRRVSLEPEEVDASLERPLADPGATVWEAPPVIAGLAVTASLGVAMATTMGIGLATHGAYEEAREAGHIARGDRLRERGRALNVSSDVLLAATVASALATTGVVLFLPTDESGTAAAKLRWTGTGAALRVDF